MNILWYPPAETKLPWSLMFWTFLPSNRKPENSFRSILGTTAPVVLGCSGRALLCELLIQLKTLNGGKRDEILIPGYTCYSVAAAVARARLKISVYDLDPSNFNPDPTSLKKKASKRTLSILSQHLFGIPTPVDNVSEIAEEVGAAHIEDAAQALGGTLHGKPLGTFGDYGLFSFGRGKPLPLGGGGALIGNDNFPIDKIHLNKASFGIKTMAACATARIIGKPLFYGFAEKLPLGLGQTIFDPDFKMSDISLSSKRLLFHSDDLLDKLNAHRRMIADVYEKEFNGYGSVPLPENSTPVYTRYPVFINNNSVSDELRQFGIRRMYPNAIVDERLIALYLSESDTQTPGATEISKKLITLPTHLGVSEKTAKKIVNALKKNRNYNLLPYKNKL